MVHSGRDKVRFSERSANTILTKSLEMKKGMRSLGPPFTDHGLEKAERKLIKKFKTRTLLNKIKKLYKRKHLKSICLLHDRQCYIPLKSGGSRPFEQ